MRVGLKIAFVSAVAFGSLAAVANGQQPPPSGAAAKRTIARTQDDLPRHSYPITGTAAALLSSDDATFNAWAGKVVADVDLTLRTYDIVDAAARRRLLGTRLFYLMLTEHNDKALATVREIRALETKADAKLTSGLREEAILQARIDTGTSSGPAFEDRYAKLYYRALAAVPFSVAGSALKETKARTDILSTARTVGYIANEVEPKVLNDHVVGDKGADDILWARAFRKIEEPLKTASSATLARVIADNRVEKADIWTARDVTLSSADAGRPVTVAIWDSGVDTKLLPGQLYLAIDHSPKNPNGLSFDVESRPSVGVLRPLMSEQATVYPQMLADMRGYSDLQAAIDSPAADALKRKLDTLPPNDNAPYIKRLSFFGDYVHGTHVAGIAARGNPFIRLAVIRDTEDYRAVPPPPTDQTVARRIALYQRVSAWLKANRVRVVNMSWGDYPTSYENDLEKNGIGKDAAERRAMARRYFARARAAFAQLLANNPGTLFVASAGNNDSDNGFDEAYPSALKAPNLIVVSATDQSGEETSFTSSGKNVAVSASGYQVSSFVPGGSLLALSGTSMAAPNVVNLAAKLIALGPSLTPTETIDLIVRNATVSKDGKSRNIDGAASISALKRRK